GAGRVGGLRGWVWWGVGAHGLYGAEAADVCQTVWLRFVEHLRRLREPERAGAWLATTARHECLRVLRRRGRSMAMAEPPEVPDVSADADPGAKVVAAEEHELLMSALDGVSEQCRQLLRLLIAALPLSYAEISDALELPKGSIGPTRQRCLVRLRAVITTLRGTTPRGGGIRPGTGGSGRSKEVQR